MSRIDDLTPAQLGRHAFNVFMFNGRHVKGARLIFHALKLDRYEPIAIRCLSDIMDSNGTEQLSAATLEFALAKVSPISGDERNTLDDLLFLAKWSWGFSRHSSGSPHLSGDDFKDRSKFQVDEKRYKEFLDGFINIAGSIEQAFVGAHTLCGAMGGLLIHEKYGAKAPLEEIIHPDRFSNSPEYTIWLKSDTKELDALERERQQRSKK